ncbi:hypothetical protein NSMM_90024 [Nitrosomonas mobilis]|uniref:Uncharacterized protein n=1 Tax=Nitrosomonas mobilis TaxID=51642 RepID=A0A1G5SJ83_9PROT|nr:hypothetical protein NSMM_90024 [Nitrosomonas mobilis]
MIKEHASKYGRANALIGQTQTDYVLIDESHDGDEFSNSTEAPSAVTVIPLRQNRIIQRDCWHFPGIQKIG